jgi:hypothetical protein
LGLNGVLNRFFGSYEVTSTPNIEPVGEVRLLIPVVYLVETIL